jgi:transcriptional regulator with XRE-family HTH domain
MNLKEVRFHKGITQCQLGVKTNICQARISLIETAQYIPSPEEIKRISEALEIPAWKVDWPEDVLNQDREAACR